MDFFSTPIILRSTAPGSVVVVVWSLARIMAPRLLLGRLDGWARFLFAAWQLYAVAQGASAVVLGFTAMELMFGVLQWWRVESVDQPWRWTNHGGRKA